MTTNFIYDNTGLPIGKTNAGPLPPGVNPTQWGVAAEWITVLQALLDVQGWARRASWLGIAPHATDPAPAGVADYVWLRNDDVWMHNNTPIGGGGGGVSSITAGAGLTGGTITTSGTIALADTAVTPGSYTNVSLTVDQKGRVTAITNGTAGISGVTMKTQPAPNNGPAGNDQFQALAINPAGTKVYVGGMNSPDPIWYFNTTTNLWDTTAPAPIPLLNQFQLVFNLAGTKLYSFKQNGSAINIIDPGTNTVTGTVSGLPGGGNYLFMALNPSGTELWVVDASGNQIRRIDTATDTYIASIAVGVSNPYHLAFSAAGAKAYVIVTPSFSFGPRVVIIDAVAHTVITTINDTPFYRAFVALPNNSEVWVAVDSTGFPTPGTLARIDVATDTVVGAVSLSTYSTSFWMAAKSDSSKVYANRDDGSLDIITVASHTVTNTIVDFANFSGQLIVNPASTKLYASNPQGLTDPPQFPGSHYLVRVFDLASETIIDTIDGTSVALPAPVTVGSFSAMRIAGASVTDDGGGQALVSLPVIYDNSNVVDTNIKANRPFPRNSIIDSTKNGVTNFGAGCTASGDNATVGGGTQNSATGDSSCVPGGEFNEASGAGSFAAGSGSVAAGDNSVAIGASTANGSYAVAIGDGAQADGDDAVATTNCSAGGQVSLSIGGYGGDAPAEASTAIGGYGGSATGVASFAASGYGASAEGDGSFAANEGFARGENSASFSDSETFPASYGAFAACEAQVTGQYAAGFNNGVTNANFAFAEGSGHANGPYAHAEGFNTIASGDFSHAEGAGSQATSDDAHAEGDTTVASGPGSHAEGGGTIASGDYSHAQGDTTTASAHASHAQGEQALASREGQAAYACGRFGTLGDAQTSLLVLRGLTPGSGAGESVELMFGGGGSQTLQLEDDKGYLIEVSVVAKGLVTGSPNVQMFKRRYVVRRTAGLTTIAGSGALEQLGDAASATWTLVASVGAGPDRFELTFTTGTTTSAAHVVAKVEFTEVLN